MPSNSAEYQRSYRARRKERAAFKTQELAEMTGHSTCDGRIAELEAEVRHLKAELAKRPAVTEPGYSTRPFTPVPKPGQR